MYKIRKLDEQAIENAEKKWNSIAKPLHSLGVFEDIVKNIAGIQGTQNIDIKKRCVLVMCADNGVVCERVTQTGQEVTAVVTENFAKGATSVCAMARNIGAIMYYLLFFGFMTEIWDIKATIAVSVGFVLSRSLSGLAIGIFKCAKNSGLLYTFKSAAHKKTIVTVMILYIALCVAMLCFTGVYGLGTICAAVISFLWYRHVAYSKFGGITGDIAGYFVCICEVLCVIFGGVLCVLL